MASLWGDSSLWGDGDLYYGLTNVIRRYVSQYEFLSYHTSIRVNYTAAVVPGSTTGLKIHRIRTRSNVVQE
jgi:hypothetical protein